MLVVDLDDTLLSTDLLYETVFDVASSNPMDAVRASGALAHGKAALKAAFASHTQLDVANLPYREEILAEIETARAKGERVALVSAADERLVHAVADHLGVFDECFGSSEGRNLGGEAKAQFLVDRYGDHAFDYIGDRLTDLPIWARSRRIMTVGAGPRVREAASALGPDSRHISPRDTNSRVTWHHLRAMRPHQWLKNLLVFLPAIMAHSADVQIWLAAALAFVCFSLTASGVYVLNDLLDLSADRAHPRKRHRPFASGAVPLKHGLVMAPILMGTAMVLSFLMMPVWFTGVLLIYLITTFAYSMALKREMMIDICTLAGLYTLRIIAGGAATGIALTPWLLAFSFFLFLALAALKRQAELVDGLKTGRTKVAGRAYSPDDMQIIAIMALASGYISVLVLALYITNPSVESLYQSPQVLWAVCPVLFYWISRAAMLTHRGEMNDDPVIFAVTDRVSLICGGLIFAIAATSALL